jgi:methionyl-tRNA formyltransferase
MVDTLQQRRQGSLLPRSQNHSKATFAPMLKKADGKIDWHLPSGQLNAFIRAMTPWPGAHCFLEQKRFKICKAQPSPTPSDATPGVVVPGFPDELCIATGDGVLSIQEIQGASGKTMAVKDFLRGHRILPGMCFS